MTARRTHDVHLVVGDEQDVISVDAETELNYLPVLRTATRNVAELLLRALKSEEASRKRVAGQRVEPVERAAEAVIGRLMRDAYSSDITDAQLSDRAQVAIDAFNVVLSGDRRQLDSMIEALKPVGAEAGVPVDLEQARARARLRMQAIYRRLLEEALTVGQLRPYKSRQRLQQLRDEGRLFAIKTPFERGLVYPVWQFDENYDPLLAMPKLIRTAREAGLSALGLHQVMTGRRENAKTGVELLAGGREDLVLGMLRAVDRGAAEPADALHR